MLEPASVSLIDADHSSSLSKKIIQQGYNIITWYWFYMPFLIITIIENGNSLPQITSSHRSPPPSHACHPLKVFFGCWWLENLCWEIWLLSRSPAKELTSMWRRNFKKLLAVEILSNNKRDITLSDFSRQSQQIEISSLWLQEKDIYCWNQAPRWVNVFFLFLSLLDSINNIVRDVITKYIIRLIWHPAHTHQDLNCGRAVQ